MQKQLARTVFVAEDDEDMRSLLRFYLEREGYRVLAAADGQEASDLIASGVSVDFALLDYMLPFIDGLQVVKRIRSSAKWRQVPILLLTTRANERDIVRTLNAGADDYVLKPFRPQELLARVRRLLPEIRSAA